MVSTKFVGKILVKQGCAIAPLLMTEKPKSTKTPSTMKLGIGFLALVVSLAACRKEQPQPTQLANQSQPVILKQGGGAGCCTTFWEMGSNAGCDGECCDCMSCGTVKKEHKAAINDVFSAVQSGNSTTIHNAFVTNKTVLEVYVNPTDVANVINGSSTVRSKGTDPTKSRYLIISTSATTTGRQVYVL
ncbi:MAG: hypothetical protein JST38_02665 [Bacteroidetes bacterium]|nr:hypothetical protein [Bacteroidota bacterium]